MIFPWYDSHWHSAYQAVFGFLQTEYPTRVDDFVNALLPLHTRKDFKPIIAHDILSTATLSEANAVIAGIGIGDWEVHEVESFGRLVLHDHPYFSDLQQRLTEQVSDMVNEEVVPSYSFLSIYNGRGVCEPHLDNPVAKWTLDIPLDASAVWPIYISSVSEWPTEDACTEDWQSSIKSSFSFDAFELASGSGLVFSGSSQWHYRNPAPIEPNFYNHLIFFHYVPTAMQGLVDPLAWSDYFGIAEIGEIIRVFQE
ncbi:MAG: hypothetical protein HOB98_17190 [Gammaproteobacteria bacterium]|jgi:hypothetical protein|nr:hypothetical protein [Gammaproteobacteria bacterium]MBT3867939.1 hypothetical protein [Gammaproteobacteria bacterium]MBT4381864.1 hypothetical protein [Gammaproteobacteria bacterium]MBT4618181.1 hypothetical protein [Gammaproteobacteria bacterium]MBT5197230.1 hypothetical protein [Gammaproteobacteria bacterium]